MVDNFIEAMKSIRSLMNYYVMFLATYSMGWLAYILRSEINTFKALLVKSGLLKRTDTFKVFGVEISSEFISLVFGILFLAFIFILFLRIRQLRTIFNLLKGSRESFNTTYHAKYLPWITSPFHPSIIYLCLFGVLLLIGFIYLLLAAVSHIIQINKPLGFRLIGFGDLIVFGITFFMTWDIAKTVVALRKKMNL